MNKQMEDDSTKAIRRLAQLEVDRDLVLKILADPALSNDGKTAFSNIAASINRGIDFVASELRSQVRRHHIEQQERRKCTEVECLRAEQQRECQYKQTERRNCEEAGEGSPWFTCLDLCTSTFCRS